MQHWERLALRALIALHPAHQWRAATAGPYVSRLHRSLTAVGVRCQAWALSAGGLVLDLEQDGSMEIIAGDKQGNIHILDALTGEL